MDKYAKEKRTDQILIVCSRKSEAKVMPPISHSVAAQCDKNLA